MNNGYPFVYLKNNTYIVFNRDYFAPDPNARTITGIGELFDSLPFDIDDSRLCLQYSVPYEAIIYLSEIFPKKLDK